MSELLTRTLSGVVLLVVVVGSILLSPWAWAAVALLIVSIGTFEMLRLQGILTKTSLFLGELLSVGAFLLASLSALKVLPERFLALECVFCMLPFLWALFSTAHDFKHLSATAFGSLALLSMPTSMTLFLYRPDVVGVLAGPRVLILVFALLWVNDIFAYLTGRLLGKHKLYERISPGKTIEGSLGGLLFTLGGVMLFSHYVSWLPMREAVGLGVIAVVFGTLGDLCESMLKRQAGVKDSGTLIPGHGGVLDRFDSVLFAVPFVFVFLLLL